MLQMANFLRDDVFPSWFANAITRALSVVSAQFQLNRLDATHIQMPAGPNGAAVVLTIQGLWRWMETGITLAHPGGAAGTYPVFATARNNNITSSPAPFTDATNYAFALTILSPGQQPTIVAGSVDVFRQVGNVVWDGTQISRVDQIVPAPPSHSGRHAVGGADPLTPAMIGAAGLGDPSSFQPGDLIPSGAATRVGCVLADGTAYLRADPRYQALFGAIGTRYGAGDGSTTFNVPDFRDKSLVGASAAHALGSSYGAASIALSAANLAPHFHGYSANTGFVSSDHSHAVNIQSGTESANHTHDGPPGTASNVFAADASGNIHGSAGTAFYLQSGHASGIESTAHSHAVNGQTGGISANHFHAVSGNTDNGSGLAGSAFSAYHPVVTVNVFVKL